MKITVLATIALSALSLAAEPYKLKSDEVIYEATVNKKKIVVFLSEAPFDPTKHKISPAVPGDGRDKRIRPQINGYSAIGFIGSDATEMKGIRHLTRLAVSFDGKLVEAPRQLIAHVLLPDTNTTFDLTERNGMVSVSSDAKAVVVDLAVGDGAWADHRAFTFSDEGGCVVGVPRPPTP